MKKELKLSLISGLLMALAWPTYGLSFLAFFGITPLLYLVELINKGQYKRKGWSVFGYSYLAFFIWNIITTWWIYNSTGFGAAFAILCNSSFYAIILTIYRWSLTRLPQKTAYLFLISFWMAFEKFHLNWDFSWPWLNLGNVFSESIYWIQWYEYTGAFGGTLWVLLVNFIGLKYLRNYFGGTPLKNVLKAYIPQLLWIAIPIVISMAIYLNTTEREESTKVVVLQPNLDPYQEKYQYTNPQLLQLTKEVTADQLDESVDFLLTPEGYFDEGYGLNLSDYRLGAFYQD
ncbi:MAG: apolipoprotein N-acyltransferase, partial [Candidatus Arcticimaribacter sp.]